MRASSLLDGGSGVHIDRYTSMKNARHGFDENAINVKKGHRSILPHEHEPAHGLLLPQRDLELGRAHGRRFHDVPSRWRGVDLLKSRAVDQTRQSKLTRSVDLAYLDGEGRGLDHDAAVAAFRACRQLRGDVDVVLRVRPPHPASGVLDVLWGIARRGLPSF